jgi:hypothetical protein
MDSLTIFGLFAVSAMLVFYALEERNTFYILCFAGAYLRFIPSAMQEKLAALKG